MPACGLHLEKSISPRLKAWVKQGDRMVCGVIGDGTTRSLSAKWDSPLEQSNVGNNISDIGGGTGQALTNMTSVTTFSSTQVWRGNMPLKFSLNLVFFAQTDAYAEVMQPLQWLEEFASGNVKGFSPIGNIDLGAWSSNYGKSSGDNTIGRIPDMVCLNIGGNIIVPECVIENISIPLDKERTSDGYLIRASVQLDIQTKVMLNRADIANTWNGTEDSNKAFFK